MKNRRSTRSVYKAIDQISTEDLLARLSPAARRRYLDSVLADDFSAFVMKVFETVSPGREFRPNWHIDGMTYAAERVIDGKIKRLITTVPPPPSQVDHLLGRAAGVSARARSDQANHLRQLFQRPRHKTRDRFSRRHELRLVSPRFPENEGQS